MQKRQLEIVNPCTQDWADMKGTGTVRHCTTCAKNVYNVSMLTEREADAALAVRPAEVCVIYYVDVNGDVVFHPEVRRKAPRSTLAAAVAASALAACSQPAPVEKEAPPVVQAPVAVSAPDLKPAPTAANVAATPEAVKTESCDTEWDAAFKDKGRTAEHFRDASPKPGGLPSRHEDAALLNPYRREDDQPSRPAYELEPDDKLKKLPNRQDIMKGVVEARVTIGRDCKGDGVAYAAIEISGVSGRATSVEVTGVAPVAAGCVKRAVLGASFSRFTTKILKVKVPFTLGG